jgi:hypothetical protein
VREKVERDLSSAIVSTWPTASVLAAGRDYGRQARLNLSHLRMYSITVQSVLERFQ